MFEKLHFQECTVKFLPLHSLISKKRVQYHIKIDILKVSACRYRNQNSFLLLHLNNRSSKTFKIVYHTNPFTFESPHTSQKYTYDAYWRFENMFTEHSGVEIGGGGFSWLRWLVSTLQRSQPGGSGHTRCMGRAYPVLVHGNSVSVKEVRRRPFCRFRVTRSTVTC